MANNETDSENLYKHITIYNIQVIKMDKKLFLAPVVIASLLLLSAVASGTDFGCVCHNEIVTNFETSLHHTGAGMKGEYEEEACAVFGIDTDDYYEQWNCKNCHATGCQDCHGDYGDMFPHEGRTDPSTNMTTCDKCHFKKQTSIYVGDLPAHNKLAVEGEETEHPADIHYEKGLVCTDCHTAEEMHGTGEEYSTMMEAVDISCEDCHNSPGKVVRDMPVTQYVPDTPSHEVHGDRLDCTACHISWSPTCTNCHLETRTGTKVVVDEFGLGIGADGKVKPFLKMEAEYKNETHIGYGEWYPHTATEEAKECNECHTNSDTFCTDGELLGDGSFVPDTWVDWLLGIPAGIIARIGG